MRRLLLRLLGFKVKIGFYTYFFFKNIQFFAKMMNGCIFSPQLEDVSER